MKFRNVLGVTKINFSFSFSKTTLVLNHTGASFRKQNQVAAIGPNLNSNAEEIMTGKMSCVVVVFLPLDIIHCTFNEKNETIINHCQSHLTLQKDKIMAYDQIVREILNPTKKHGT